jgi:folate-binding protein YgfZ
MTVLLGPADLLILTGADAASFAHAQFGSDVRSLEVGAWQWSAWLDAQGRTRHFFALIRADAAHFLAWLPLGGAQPMRDALARFVMRSAVKLDVPADWALHSLAPADSATTLAPRQVAAHAGGYAFVLPGTSQRVAWIAPGNATQRVPDALEHWRLDDIAAGLPLLAPELGGEFVPQALDLDRLQAIRFDKGCYPGQEIAARLHFRGGNKRHLQRLRIDGPAPAIGAAVLDDNGEVLGQVLYAASASATQSEALAVLMQGEAHDFITEGGMRAKIVDFEL